MKSLLNMCSSFSKIQNSENPVFNDFQQPKNADENNDDDEDNDDDADDDDDAVDNDGNHITSALSHTQII